MLARTGSFTQAARELHLTQSGVSHSMKALESDMGCRLLDRLGKKVVLTQAGEQFLHHATKILQEMENARESLAHLGKWGRGRLRLGASTTACQHLIPPVLREFKESFPDHAITIEPGDTPGLVAALLRHRIDLALALESEREPQIEFHPLFTDELHFIVGALHPWALAKHAERAEIPRQNYILYNQASVTFRIVEDYFRREQMVLEHGDRTRQHGSDQGTGEARPGRQHPRAVDRAEGNRGRLAGRAAAGPAQIAASLGHSALARQTAESRRGNVHRLVRSGVRGVAGLASGR